MSKQIDIFDKNQGEQKNGKRYGYAGIEDRGGYFFTWESTLAATLASIEADEIDPPIDFSKRAMSEVRGLIRRAYRKEKAKAFGSLIP